MFLAAEVLYTIFLMNIKIRVFSITDTRMTRFNITLHEATDMVHKLLKKSTGGEIFVPKLKSFKITDLAKAINPKNKIKIVGIRPGEKLHEQMISSSDSFSTVDLKNFCSDITKEILNFKINF